MLLTTTFISGLFFGFAFSNLKSILKTRKRRKATDKFIKEKLSKNYLSAFEENGFKINKLDTASYWLKDKSYKNESWWENND